jgi:hypothetical protein
MILLMFAGLAMTRTVIAATTAAQFARRAELGMTMRETMRDAFDDDEADEKDQ